MMRRFEKRLDCGATLSCTVESDSRGDAGVVVGVSVPDAREYLGVEDLLARARSILGVNDVGASFGQDTFFCVHSQGIDHVQEMLYRMTSLANDLAIHIEVQRKDAEEGGRVRHARFVETGAALVNELEPLVRAEGLEPVVEGLGSTSESTRVKQRVGSEGIRVRIFDVLERAVEQGVGFGWTRAHKHVDRPEKEQAVETIASEVMSAVCEWFEFPKEEI